MSEEWQPIETAPKTGEFIWLADDFSMRVGFWVDGKECEHHESKGGGWVDFCLAEQCAARDLRFKPTHWMPLPKLPGRG